MALAVAGCTFLGPSDDSKGSLLPIEGGIIFRAMESYEDPSVVGDPVIVLDMRTEKIYGCYNYSISSTIAIREDTIAVDLLGVYVPPICFTAVGPARSRRILRLSPGTYRLVFLKGALADSSNLVITDSSIRVVQRTSTFTTVTDNLSWRYPKRSFAYLCGTMTESSWICQAFADSLLRIETIHEFQFPDSGSICYPDSSDGHYYNTPARYYLYESEEDFDAAGALLADFTTAVIADQEGVSLYLLNWRDKWYRSWLLAGGDT